METSYSKLEDRLRPHMNEDTEYARLLRWRLLPPEERPVDPNGITAQAQAADLIIRPDMNAYEAEHATPTAKSSAVPYFVTVLEQRGTRLSMVAARSQCPYR